MQHSPITAAKTARQIAKDWRACPQHREAIEAQIAADDREQEFTFDRHGNLIARITAEDRRRITASGGGAYMPAWLRREMDEARNSFTERAPCGGYRDRRAA